MTLADQIPGLKEAIEREAHCRDSSFLCLPERICGIDIPQMSLRHLVLLGAVGSPFVCGGTLHQTSAAQFVLAITEAKGFARWKLIRKLRKADSIQLANEVAEYVQEAFQDSPPAGGNQVASYYSFAASLVDLFAKEYGWNEEQILNLPLKRLFQYSRAISVRYGDKTMFNPSDKVRGQWLAEQNRN